MPPTKYPPGDPRNTDYRPDVPGVQTQDYRPPTGDYVPPDSTMGAYNPNSEAGAAYGAAAAATGMTLDELTFRNNQARLGLGPPIPGFGPDGRPLPAGLSPVGYAAGGLVVGAVLSAFAGYGWTLGAAVGAAGGYAYGRFRG
jgi:hypothetical protein